MREIPPLVGVEECEDPTVSRPQEDLARKEREEQGKRKAGARRRILALLTVGALLAGSVLVVTLIESRRSSLRAAAIVAARGNSYTETAAGVNLEMVGIAGGTFEMGSPRSTWDMLARKIWRTPARRADTNEYPAHTVTLDGFWIGKYEVTQRQYEAVMGTNPSISKGPERPVEGVSWNDATAFCRKVSQLTGTTYTLPTEAQWEYACRADSTADFCFGDSESGLSDFAWYGNNSGSQPHDVGGKKPNAWGLYDMHGNLWEWCQDWYGSYSAASGQRNPTGPATGSLRVLRGGFWSFDPGYCRSAYRDADTPVYRSFKFGFRLARTQK